MGLSITVGILADLLDADPEGADDVREDLDDVNAALRARGLPEHVEPESLPPMQDRSAGFALSYSSLHRLRRIYARLLREPGRTPPPLAPGEDPAADPVLGEVASPSHHLLWHSDAEGYYVPIDFPEVLDGDGMAGAGVGSSVRLMDELIRVATALGIPLRDGRLTDADARTIADEGGHGRYGIERLAWLQLFEAARLSLEHRAAIHFG